MSTAEETMGLEVKSDCNKNKRILWLINHTTLREFEVPLLISLGFEVYTPKNIPEIILGWSGSVTEQFDDTLSIPKKDIDILNEHNFYDGPMTLQVAEIINQHFGSAFCVYYPKLLESLVHHFNGNILLRAFGLDKSNSYTSNLLLCLGQNFLNRIKMLGDRFWFSQAYDNLSEIETTVLRERSVYHPLGLPESFFINKNKWTGGENKILFFCSRINAAPEYYGKIYHEFIKNFGDLPYRVAGNQPIKVNNPHVMGQQPRAMIDQWLQTHNVMFYHSQEPRHLHYHPLEAIAVGMPLIYMKGGILEQLGGTDQPGACKTINEARQKIKKILAGDKQFITLIREKQIKILENFTYEYAYDLWNKNFVEKIIKKPKASNTFTPLKPQTICILLPVGYKTGSLNGAKNITKLLHLGSRNANEPMNIIFACEENTYDIKNDFADLLQLNIQIREFSWKVLNLSQVQQVLNYFNKKVTLTSSNYIYPFEPISNFTDCDLFLIISDRLIHQFAPFKPYGLMVYDYIQRYLPAIKSPGVESIYNNFLLNAREAKFILTTTKETAQDAIQYAGVDGTKVHTYPMEFQPLKLPKEQLPLDNLLPENYIIWPSNATQHKNHLNTLEALDIYYNQLNGHFDVVLTGHDTNFLKADSDNKYFKEIQESISSKLKVKEKLHLKGILSTNDFIMTLSRAKFLLHPVIIDNGTYSVIEAAALGVPVLSSNYPQMQFINERFHLNLCFFDPHDPVDMASKIKLMEQQYLLRKQNLPKPEFFEQFSCERQANNFWQIFRGLI